MTRTENFKLSSAAFSGDGSGRIVRDGEVRDGRDCL
jgi:hypothetical protein